MERERAREEKLNEANLHFSFSNLSSPGLKKAESTVVQARLKEHSHFNHSWMTFSLYDVMRV